MIDKSKELITSIELINQKLNFSGIVDDNSPISIDYTPPLGDNSGYTSLELLLLSLSSCMGSAILTFLRRMNKEILACSIHAKGLRKQEHPTGLSKIFIEFDITSTNIMETDMDKVIKMSLETYCPVWSMMKGNVELVTNYKIHSPQGVI